MASRYLVAGITDLSDANAWAATRTGAGGETAPTTGDDVFIVDGSQAITAGLTQLNVDLESVTIGAGFTGTLGSAGSSATIGCHNSADAKVTVEAGPASQIHIAAGTAGIENLDVRMSGGTFRLTGGTTDDANFYSGKVYIDSGAVVTNANNFGAQMVVETNGTGFTTLRHTGGSLDITDRDVATMVQDGLNTRSVLRGDTAVSSSLTITGGAYCNYRTDGTLAALVLYDSTFTVAGAPDDMTITTLTLLSKNARAITTAGTISASVGTLNDNGFNTITQASADPGIPNGFE